MSTLNMYRQIPGLLAGGTLFANCLLLWGCPQQEQKAPQLQQTQQQQIVQSPTRYIRYPAVVFDVPRCYDRDEKTGKCNDYSSDLYLDFEFLSKSDSVLWEDIDKLRKRNKFWRLIVSKASDNTLAGNSSANGSWSPVSNITVRMTLPLEVLLAADFEFCSRDTIKDCDDDTSDDKTVARKIPFLMHTFPEPPTMQKKEKSKA